jgi:hypothetical protein
MELPAKAWQRAWEGEGPLGTRYTTVTARHLLCSWNLARSRLTARCQEQRGHEVRLQRVQPEIGSGRSWEQAQCHIPAVPKVQLTWLT